MTVAIPRSRRVLEHEHVDDVCTPGGTPVPQRTLAALPWQDQVFSVSPLAVLDEVRDDPWRIHRPGRLAQDYLTFVMAMPRHDPLRGELESVTHLCGDRKHLAAWLRGHRVYAYRQGARDGGPIAVETARNVLEVMLRGDLKMAREVLETTLTIAPHAGILRLLEVWLLALDRELDRHDAAFACEAIPLKGRTNHRLRNFLLRDGPAPGMNWRALAKSTLRRL